MMVPVSFRPYSSVDRNHCLNIFDANCPEFFAPNERDDYRRFLDDGAGGYEVCELAGRVVASFGLVAENVTINKLTWIMLDPSSQGAGIGSEIMRRIVTVSRGAQADLIKIAASHKSAPFFEKFGATAISFIKDGWGPQMDRVDMELRL